jgi:hypothetical protein
MKRQALHLGGSRSVKGIRARLRQGDRLAAALSDVPAPGLDYDYDNRFADNDNDRTDRFAPSALMSSIQVKKVPGNIFLVNPKY